MRKRRRTAIRLNFWFDKSKFDIVLIKQVKQTLSMKIGYARVSTRDQKSDLQVDALKAAGCERVYQDVASGAKTARPALDELLGQLRAGDVLVIWKLDRMGRSLKHLVELVGSLMERKVGLLSLNDPIATASSRSVTPDSADTTTTGPGAVSPAATSFWRCRDTIAINRSMAA